MDEVVVAVVDTEVVAEVIAERLRTEGIAARVRYDSTLGIPRQIAPAGLGLALGAFRVAVSAADAAPAREVIAEAGPRTERSRPVQRAISVLLLIAFVASFIPGTIELFRVLLGLGR